MKQALQALIYEMEYVLSCINEEKIPFDGDDFHEALRLGKEALANHCEDNLDMVKQEQEDNVCARCGGIVYDPVIKQKQGEPVAWSYWQSCLNDDGTQTAPWVHRLSQFKPHESIINKDVVPLYTTPQQRKPLTDEEIRKTQHHMVEGAYHYSFKQGVRFAEKFHGIKE